MFLPKTILFLIFYNSFWLPVEWPGNYKRPDKIKWVVQKSSSLSIAGRTNVNRFCCEVVGYTGPDTISSPLISSHADDKSIPLNGTLRINIGDFNCRNRIMTAEFKKTLKSLLYPQLKIEFVSLEKMPAFNGSAETITGWVNIELAGISKRFEICYTSSRTDASTIELIGERNFGFSDFGLTPPRKMGGLIRVSDQLNVQFHLYLKES